MRQNADRPRSPEPLQFAIVLTLALLVLAALLSSHGCGSARHYEDYIEPKGANAQIVVHTSGDTYDVFLDEKLLGRISWTQPHRISAGKHVLRAKEAPPYLFLPEDATFPFTIAPGETIHFRIHMYYPSDTWPGESEPGYLVIDRFEP